MRVPELSPFGLIQEQLFPNEWLILVSCMLLNCTSRKQVQRIMPEFIRLWSTPEDFTHADKRVVQDVIRGLGFASRRSANLFKMTEAYLKREWKHASELSGIGQYAARAWEIFCKGDLGTEPPVDHALVKYWSWRKAISASNEKS